VVVTAACVAPLDGASATPDALELEPHAASPIASTLAASASTGVSSRRFNIGV
jgi:hypothetical protein